MAKKARTFVRADIPLQSLQVLAEGLNRLPGYPARLGGRQRLKQTQTPSAIRLLAPEANPWLAARAFLEVLAPVWGKVEEKPALDLENLSPKAREALLGLAPLQLIGGEVRQVRQPERWTERDALESVRGFLRGLLGDSVADRVKRCAQCHRWFVDATKNHLAARCSRRCTWQWWSRSRRRERGHSQYRRRATGSGKRHARPGRGPAGSRRRMAP